MENFNMKRQTRGVKINNPSSQYPQYIHEKFPLNEFTYQAIPDTKQGKVYKEILDNYDSIKYPFKGKKSQASGDTAAYDPTQRKKEHDQPFVELPDEVQPASLAHELMHSEDHRKHYAYKKIWQNIQNYATKNKINTWDDLSSKLAFIQDKIDPTQAFRSNYSLGSEYLNNDIQAVFKDKKKKNITHQITPDAWGDITKTVNQNHLQFPLNYASEYPSFMMERLTDSWKTDQGSNPLGFNEQKFLYDTLGDMSDAYPGNDYPVMNRYIQKRRDSIKNTDTWKKQSPIIIDLTKPKKGYKTTDSPSSLGQHPAEVPIELLLTENDRDYLQEIAPPDVKLEKFDNNKKTNLARGGSVSSNYDPYLNTYNYRPQISLLDYMAPQTPDSRYEDGGSEYPGISYENAYDTDGQQYSFKEGGSVGDEDLPKLADLIRRHGRNGDTELAHINPIEAHILKSLGGSGTINPATGLREYSFWKKPFKAIKSVIGGGAGAIIGNMIAPGIGGIIGGAIGQGAQHAARGKSALGGALKGAGMGAALPSMASGLGWGVSKLGATALGSSLSNYGSANAILPALGLGTSGGSSGLFGLGGSNPYVSGGLSAATALSSGMGGGVPPQYGQYPQMQYPGYPYVDNRGFLEKFGDNAKDYLTQPGNLLTLGTVAAQYAGRQKPKSPEKIAEEERRYRNASRKTIAEVEADEALETARADLQKKRKNKQLEEDINNMGSVQRRVVSPEEFARTGRWLEYTDEEGRPIRMKGGGSAHSPYAYLTEEIYSPLSPIGYLSGDTGGQDDLIDARLSDGEYVFDASTVSDLGDGNNAAGARKLDGFRENIRRHKRGGKVNLPPRSKSLESYLRG